MNSPFSGNWILLLFAILYAAGASHAAWEVIDHTQRSTDAIDQILSTYNMKNEGEQALNRYTDQHPFLGMFISSPIRHQMELPSHEESTDAIHSDVTHELHTVRQEASVAAWWSWFFLCLSFFYIVSVIVLERTLLARGVIFALTAVSLVCFVIGILAPAMVIWTAPNIPMATGPLNFVLQHEVRGIAAIIKDLLTKGHLVIGLFLLLFSIVTPLTKASLTFFATACHSREINFRIGQLLHSIGKWSMADVFVAGILLALYALKAQEATKSIPCLGLYYFIGYCLFSMTTTELLMHSGLVDEKHEKHAGRVGFSIVAGLFIALFCFISASGIYTYREYTVPALEKVQAPSSPGQLNNSHFVLPEHQ